VLASVGSTQADSTSAVAAHPYHYPYHGQETWPNPKQNHYYQMTVNLLVQWNPILRQTKAVALGANFQRPNRSY